MKLRFSEQQLRQQVRYFGYYQIGGGIVMLGTILWALAQTGTIMGLLLLVYGGYLALASFVVHCGYLTLKQPRLGLQRSRISLLVQLVGFAVGGIGLRFFAGPHVTLTFSFSRSISATLGASLSDFHFKAGSDAALTLSINLVALLLFLRTTQWFNEWNYRYTGSTGPAEATTVPTPDAHA